VCSRSDRLDDLTDLAVAPAHFASVIELLDEAILDPTTGLTTVLRTPPTALRPSKPSDGYSASAVNHKKT